MKSNFAEKPTEKRLSIDLQRKIAGNKGGIKGTINSSSKRFNRADALLRKF